MPEAPCIIISRTYVVYFKFDITIVAQYNVLPVFLNSFGIMLVKKNAHEVPEALALLYHLLIL